jgi:hypothetical protein
MSKRVWWTTGIIGGVFIFAQAIYPPHVNQPGIDLFQVHPAPAPVVKLFQSACYDCHSQETKWPWYSHVAPVSWMITHDVNSARKHFDFSHWDDKDPKREARKLSSMSEAIVSGDMPPSGYTFMHSEAKLDYAQKQAMTDWLAQQAANLSK